MLSKVIAQNHVDHVEKWFEKADKIVIVTHVSPDGDAIGSSLGLYHFLSSQEKNVTVIVPNAFPDFLRWMSGAKDIMRLAIVAESEVLIGWYTQIDTKMAYIAPDK
jgi:phosphoesterase RecJ-like protein